MKSFKPLIRDDEAKEFLSLRGRIFRKKRVQPLKIELIYLPYYFFKIKVCNRKGNERFFLVAIDAITASFTFVDETKLEATELEECEFAPRISQGEAKEALLKEARWFLYQKSIRSSEKYKLVDVLDDELCWYPFWVGYYQTRSKSLDFLALDAISGVLQGGPARKVFVIAFSQYRL